MIYDRNNKNPIKKDTLKNLLIEADFYTAWKIFIVYIKKLHIDTLTTSIMKTKLIDNYFDLSDDELRSMPDNDVIKDKTNVQAFRGSGKTTLLTESYVSLYILRNPESSTLISTKADDQALSILSVIKKDYEDGGVIYDVFGDLLSTRHGENNSKQLTLKRKTNRKEPTVMAVGINSSAIVSKHFDQIILDDIVDDRTVGTLNMRNKLETRLEESILAAVDKMKGSKTHFVGTHYHPDDIYVRYQKKKDIWTDEPIYSTYKFPAIVKVDDKEYFTRDLPLRVIRDILNKRQNNPLSYRQQYQQEVSVSEGKIFKSKWIQYYKDIIVDNDRVFVEVEELNYGDGESEELRTRREEVAVYIGVDLATSKKDTADNTVISVIGVSNSYNIYLLDMYVDKISFFDQLNIISNYYHKWPMTQRIGIESNAFQAVAYETITNISSLPVLKIITSKDKILRMNQFSAHWENGKVYVNPNLRHYKILEDELLEFPDAPHDDTIDSFYLAFETMKHVLEEQGQGLSWDTLSQIMG